MLLRLLMPADRVQCYSGAIERFDVLRMFLEDGAERCEGFCMLLSPEHDLREPDLTIDIAGRYRKRLAKRGVCPIEVAIAHERPPEIDPGLRGGRLTFRDPPLDVGCIEGVSTTLGGLGQPRQRRGVEIGAARRRLGRSGDSAELCSGSGAGAEAECNQR